MSDVVREFNGVKYVPLEYLEEQLNALKPVVEEKKTLPKYKPNDPQSALDYNIVYGFNQAIDKFKENLESGGK